MKRIGSRARRNRDLAAWSATELRSEGRGLDPKLLHRIDRHQAVGSARRAQRGQRSTCSLDKSDVAGHAEVRADTIDGEVVRVRPLSVHAELALLRKRRGRQNNAGSQSDQRLKAAAVQR